jgi:RES domain-containing protein
MIVWRLTGRPHADLSGRGGELADGRWHMRGRPIVYCAASAALALLEARLHLDLPLDLLPDDYDLMKMDAPDELAVRTIGLPDLPAGWRLREDLCRRIGDARLAEAAAPLLSVPSAVVEVERNILINPRHASAKRIAVNEIVLFGWDERLLR